MRTQFFYYSMLIAELAVHIKNYLRQFNKHAEGTFSIIKNICDYKNFIFCYHTYMIKICLN